MHFYCLFIACVISSFCFSQEVISSGGEQYVNTGGSITFTIGEPVVETVYSSSNLLTQGFQQNYESILTISPLASLIPITVYPNPFNEVLTIDLTNAFEQILELSILDLHGKVILQTDKTVPSPSNSIELVLSDLSEGLYFLQINFSNDVQLTYRVIKNN